MRHKRLNASKQGTASVEVVVMLPLFITAFLGIFYIHRVVVAAQEAGVAARGCAWDYALRGCDQEGPLCVGVRIADAGSIDEANELGKGESAPEHEKAARSVIDEVAEWPLLGDAVEAVFGKGTTASATREVAAFRSDDTVSMSRRSYVICNTQPMSWRDQIEKLMDHVIGWTK